MTDTPDHLTAEIAVRCIQPPPGQPAFSFGPRQYSLRVGPGYQSVSIDSAFDVVEVEFRSLTMVDDHWYGGVMALRVNGSSIAESARPFLHYDGPTDIHMQTVFSSPWAGYWVVGTRAVCAPSSTAPVYTDGRDSS